MRLPLGLQAVLLSVFLAFCLLLLNWESIISWVLTTQQQLHLLLRTHVAAVANDPLTHGWLLVAASFGYGVFHAIGPGHGKALIAGYLGTQTQAGFKQGMLLSFLGSLMQSVIAVVIVTLFALLLNISVGKITQQDWILEAVSFALVTLLGLVMIFRALHRKWQSRHTSQVEAPHVKMQELQFQPQNGLTLTPTNTHPSASFSLHHDHGPDCGCQHHVEVDDNASWKEKLLLVGAMGFRPCSGALIVLVYSHLVGVYGFGVLAVMAMGVGTGMAVAGLAVLVVSCRQWFQHQLSRPSLRLGIDGGFWLKLVGGCLLVALGASLLAALTIAPPPHPIL